MMCTSHTLLTVVLVLFLTPTSRACPVSCLCMTKMAGLEVVCEGGQLMNILPDVPETTASLLLTKVSGAKKLTHEHIQLLEGKPLAKLKISQCQVKDIEPSAFQSLEKLLELDLSENELFTLHTLAFDQLKEIRTLNLSNNHLSSLGDSLQPLNKLLRLDLSGNNLQDLTAGVFKSQANLRSLLLNRNSLRNLYGHYFEGLDDLRDLRLRDGSVSSIHESVFSNIPKLTSLDLGGNRLTAFPNVTLLNSLENLQRLYFDKNELVALSGEQFKGLSLQSLSLSRNRISTIDSDTFVDTGLRDLDLSYNMIISLSKELLQPLSENLNTLNVAGNPLRQLEQETFGALKRLTVLNISACSLDDLQVEVFQDLPMLDMLDISHNNLHSLSKPILKFFDNLMQVNLHQNAWVCDCQMIPVRDWLQKSENAAKLHCSPSQHTQDDCSELRCSAPAPLHHAKLSLLKDADLEECDHDGSSSSLSIGKQGAIVASCMGVAIILLIITIYLWRRGKTRHGLKRVCVPSQAESSHVVDEDSKIPPLENCDRESLNESDHSFIFRHYFDQMVTDPKLMSRTSFSEEPTSPLRSRERDSLYSSQPSLYSSHSITIGIESTV